MIQKKRMRRNTGQEKEEEERKGKMLLPSLNS